MSNITKDWKKELQVLTEWQGGLAIESYWLTSRSLLESFIQNLLDRQKAETDMRLAQGIGQMRQWLNEDRITELDRMVTNEMLGIWLKDLDEQAEQKSE